MEYHPPAVLFYAVGGKPKKYLKMMILLVASVSQPTFSHSRGMPWFRACSSDHEVILSAEEGIIETPVPDVFGSNCGGPIHPGICCRWKIVASDPDLRIQISILDSTLPIKRSGRCYRDNAVTIVDGNNRRLGNLCGPVGLAQTVIVPTAGASLGFTGLLKNRAMATLHYKVIGCKDFPSHIKHNPVVENIDADAFSANLTCVSGSVQSYKCIGRTWHPSLTEFSCEEYTAGQHTSSNPNTERWSGVDETKVTIVIPFTSPTSKTILSDSSSGNNSSAGNSTASNDGKSDKRMGKILLALIVLGSASALLLMSILIVTILRQFTNRKAKYQLAEESSTEPSPHTDGGFHTDLYEEIENNHRLLSASCLSPPNNISSQTSSGNIQNCNNKPPLSEEVARCSSIVEADYALPNKKRRSGLEIIENDIYEQHVC